MVGIPSIRMVKLGMMDPIALLTLGQDPVVCPHNIEDALLSNMKREIAEHTVFAQCFLV